MRGNKRSDTRPELAVRRLLHALGYRYRLHASDLPGKPDIVFRPRKIAVFVHGCFWHQHADLACPLRSAPSTNRHYWLAKLARNVQRDAENKARLCALGWRVETVWECEVADPEELKKRLEEILAHGL